MVVNFSAPTPSFLTTHIGSERLGEAIAPPAVAGATAEASSHAIASSTLAAVEDSGSGASAAASDPMPFEAMFFPAIAGNDAPAAGGAGATAEASYPAIASSTLAALEGSGGGASADDSDPMPFAAISFPAVAGSETPAAGGAGATAEGSGSKLRQYLFGSTHTYCAATRTYKYNTYFSPGHMCLQRTIVDPALPHLSEKEVIIAGEVMNDGLGDFFNMMSVIHEINDTYPGQKIRLILHMDNEYYIRIRSQLICPKNVTLDILPYGCPFSQEQIKRNYSQIKEGQQVKLPEELKVAVENAAYTLGYYTCNISKDTLASHYIIPSPRETFTEAGYGRCTLTGKDGIGVCFHSRRTEKALSLSALSNRWLKETLRYLYNPSEARLCFGYFNDNAHRGASTLSDFIYLSAAGIISDHSVKSLVIVSNVCSLTGYKLKLEKILSGSGFSEIIIKNCSGHDERVSIPGTGSRKIYVLNPFPLTHEDFTILRASSTSALVGCTGDQSLFEVLQDRGHVPFYQVRKHKKVFWKDFILFAQERLGDHHPYVSYLKLMESLIEAPKDDSYFAEYVEDCDSSSGATLLKEYDDMLALVKEADFISGADLVHAALLAEKSAPRYILAQIQTALGIHGTEGAGAGAAAGGAGAGAGAGAC